MKMSRFLPGDNDSIISKSRLATFYQRALSLFLVRLYVAECSPQYTLGDLNAIVLLCIQPQLPYSLRGAKKKEKEKREEMERIAVSFFSICPVSFFHRFRTRTPDRLLISLIHYIISARTAN